MIVYPIAALYFLWIFYLALMSLKRGMDNGKMTKVAKILAMPLYYFGWVLDILVNWSILSLILLEFPHEYTFTARLKRHALDEGYRGKLSRWVAINFLDPYDPSGKHI
jgi:hypothetical protein